VVSLLECSINGVDITVALTPGTVLGRLHQNAPAVVEHTTCNYGLNPAVEQIASMHGMIVAGRDDLGEVRAIERVGHPFFVATLYQPQLRSTPDRPHPVFAGLIAAAASRRS
jgi:CTP synthase (UTP-ammonia lyase)